MMYSTPRAPLLPPPPNKKGGCYNCAHEVPSRTPAPCPRPTRRHRHTLQGENRSSPQPATATVPQPKSQSSCPIYVLIATQASIAYNHDLAHMAPALLKLLQKKQEFETLLVCVACACACGNGAVQWQWAGSSSLKHGLNLVPGYKMSQVYLKTASVRVAAGTTSQGR